MARQHSHTTTPFSTKKFPVSVICDQVQSPANIGALFRICDAFGVSEVLFGNPNVSFSSSRLRRTSRDTHKKVNYRVCEDIISEIKKLKEKEYRVLVLEITDDSIPLEKLKFSASGKIALVIGNERHGISDPVLQQADQSVHITMHGENSSMNVVQATAIALHAITNKLMY